MTKKQMTALSTIIALETARFAERNSKMKPGVHPCYDKWLMTDGSSAVILTEKPEGLLRSRKAYRSLINKERFSI